MKTSRNSKGRNSCLQGEIPLPQLFKKNVEGECGVIM